jgi:cytochrome P450
MRERHEADTRTIDETRCTWNPRDPAVLENQRDAYDDMRRRCPVAHSDALGWSLFGHGDVTTVTGDPVAFSSATRRLAIPNGMDPPDHTAYRGSLQPYFTVDRLAGFEPRSRQIAHDLAEAIIWEILRMDGPLVSNNRTVTRDVEIGGLAIRTGERISLMWMAANRDLAVFTDAEQVNVERDRADNLRFGAGIHRCLGEPLALLNVRVGVEELLRGVGHFELLALGTPSRNVYPSNGLRELPLRLRPGVSA